MLAAAPAAMAVPAKPGLLTVTQADGTTLNVRLMGDERHHFYLTEDGYLLADRDNTFYYADVDAAGDMQVSAIRATNVGLRDGVARSFLAGVDMQRVYKSMNASAERASSRLKSGPMRGPGLFNETNFPGKGKQKAIVILVEYTDVKMQTPDAHNYFANMLNQPGFSDHGGTGSARDFFLESSMGQFDPQFDVDGPVTLAHPMSYYGGNDWAGNDQRPEEMIIEACQLLDSEIDFTQYDRDGDGMIDNVYVFYAGQGEASGGASNTVWPHSWNIYSGAGRTLFFDGVQLDRYGCSNEWEGSRPDGVGTFVHEFSHVLGLPDLYATSYTSAFTPGAWSALDYGPYNNDGCTPPLYSAFERYAMDWIEPDVISGPMNATLPPIGTNICGIIKTDSSNEFFLLENRQQTGWDTYIPGHGMLVWHVDFNTSVWSSNSVNNSSSHQYVDIEEADGTQSEYSRAGDAFPGTSGKTSFTDDTTPNMLTWGRKKLNLPITDIAESADGIITFKVAGGTDEVPAPVVANDADEVSTEAFTATWEAAEGAGDDASYVLNVYSRSSVAREPAAGSDGSVTYLPGFRNKVVRGATSCEVTGLEPETDYYYTVNHGTPLQMSAASNEVSVFTGRLPLTRRAVVAVAASEVTETGFTAAWEELPDAESYLLTVYTKQAGGVEYDECGFDDGVTALPEGWTASSRSSYSSGSYCGTSAPSLRLGNTGEYVQTPGYPQGITSLSFWHRGNGCSDDDRISISALVEGKWTVAARLEITTTSGGHVYELADEIPAGATALRIEYVRTGTRGSLAVDDIKVGLPCYALVPVEGYSEYPAGSGTSCAVSGLDADTEYFYTVVAVSGDMRSLVSNEIAVRTSKSSGIDDVAADITDADAPAEYYNLQGARVSHPERGQLYILRRGSTAVKVRY